MVDCQEPRDRRDTRPAPEGATEVTQTRGRVNPTLTRATFSPGHDNSLRRRACNECARQMSPSKSRAAWLAQSAVSIPTPADVLAP